jgi:hypothetical protein
MEYSAFPNTNGDNPMTLNITFKAKIRTARYADDTFAYEYIQVPAMKRHYCDMGKFRNSPKFGAYANSDLFLSMLERTVERAGVKKSQRMDLLPSCVSIDRSGFLAEVTISIEG